MKVRAIVAVDPAHAIGQDGGLPWHYAEDLQFFKRATLGHTVLMGRRTFESIGRPLPGRTNVVLSRSGFAHPGVVSARTIEDATQVARERGGDLFVIGGAAVYLAARDIVDEWIVTRVPDVHPDADTFLDPSLLAGFRTTHTESLGALAVDFMARA